ncbi:hypothetical protein GMMP15_1110014 [Candidatus Magnetomoraceae bacterium gMMP-15]
MDTLASGEHKINYGPVVRQGLGLQACAGPICSRISSPV